MYDNTTSSDNCRSVSHLRYARTYGAHKTMGTDCNGAAFSIADAIASTTCCDLTGSKGVNWIRSSITSILPLNSASSCPSNVKTKRFFSSSRYGWQICRAKAPRTLSVKRIISLVWAAWSAMVSKIVIPSRIDTPSLTRFCNTFCTVPVGTVSGVISSTTAGWLSLIWSNISLTS